METVSQNRPVAAAYLFTAKTRATITRKLTEKHKCTITRGGIHFRFYLWFAGKRVQWAGTREGETPAGRQRTVVSQGLAETVFDACEVIEREIGGLQWDRSK